MDIPEGSALHLYSPFCLVLIVSLAAFTAGPTFASEQVYHPVNPTFGGNAQNGSFLLSTAQTQGAGVKSGQSGPDLSGLTSALSSLGSQTSVASPTIVIGSPTTPTNP